MQRYFVHLAYSGQRYRGYQRQKDKDNIQGLIEGALSSVFKMSIGIYACGRTDAGVHAAQFYAHFDGPDSWEFDALFRLNKQLPDDISIFELIKVADRAHARYDAEGRTYQYFFHTEKIPSLTDFSSRLRLEGWDFQLASEAVQQLIGSHDFRAFSKSPDQYPNTNCIVHKSKLSRNKFNDQFCFEITANRFLKGMIRNLMARVIQVGKGQCSMEKWSDLLLNQIEEQLPLPAPPNGLYLSKIDYPFFVKAPRIQPAQMMLYRKDDFWKTGMQ